jgi:anti-sigma regulatory factor (Ser/Thr protein kinase)
VDQPSTTASYQRSFPAAAPSAAAIREFVRQVLRQVSDRTDMDAAVLLVSELVNNAILHAGSSDVDVQVDIGGDSVVVAVGDRDPAPPVMRQTASTGPGGRGLAIVARCSEQWGVSAQAGGGKRVWFRLNLSHPTTRR